MKVGGDRQVDFLGNGNRILDTLWDILEQTLHAVLCLEVHLRHSVPEVASHIEGRFLGKCCILGDVQEHIMGRSMILRDVVGIITHHQRDSQ